MKKSHILLIITAVLITTIITSVAMHTSSHPPSKPRILLGAWVEGLYDAKTKKLQPERLQTFEKMVQKKLSIAHYYRGWESLADTNLIQEFNLLHSQGWIPMLNANPYYFSECVALQTPLYKAIAEGHCDDYIHKAAKNLRNVRRPFYFLFAWEMNNSVHEWSIVHTGSTSQDFIKAWQRVYTIFKQERADNVIWVYCPNIPSLKEMSYKSTYPGYAYVDWLALDGYNWGDTQSWSKWSSFTDVFGGPYKELVAFAPNKPVMIAEMNTSDKGGNKAQWYEETFLKEIPFQYPNIKAVVIYNEDRSEQEHVNWKVEVSKESLSSFIKAIHSSFYY